MDGADRKDLREERRLDSSTAFLRQAPSHLAGSIRHDQLKPVIFHAVHEWWRGTQDAVSGWSWH